MIGAAVLALALALASPLPALAFDEEVGTLTAAESCEAFVSFRQRRNPDGARLTVGERYAVRGRNQPGGPWLRIELPGVRPTARWVEERCGLAAIADGRSGLRPFFDQDDEGAADPAPPPPPLTALDRAVLAVCGPWGSRPRRAAFRAMLERPELAGELARVRTALDEEPPGRLMDEITRVWFAAGGFRHVFCGEPRADGIAGLHYRGRYLELQEAGVLGLADPSECPREIDPPVFTIGVRFRPTTDGPFRTACPKGYDAALSAADILIAGVRAWRGSTGRRMCLASLGRGRWAVAVLQEEGLRTFYPDASPRCDGGGRPAGCACGS